MSEVLPRETAADLRLSPRKVPLFLLPYFYLHTFHFIPLFLFGIVICFLILNFPDNDGGFAGEIRREIQSQWKPAGTAKVLRNKPFFDDKILLSMFLDTEFEYTDANGKKQCGECGSFTYRFDTGKEYPLETLFDVCPRFRLTGTYSGLFFNMLLTLGFFGSISFLYLLFMLYFIRCGSRKLQLFRCGVAAVGTFAGKEKIFILTRMLFDFQDEYGETHRCKRQLFRKKPVDKIFTEQQPVVIYDSNKPEQVLFVEEFGIKTQYDWQKRELILSAWTKYEGWMMYFCITLVLAVTVFMTVMIVLR